MGKGICNYRRENRGYDADTLSPEYHSFFMFSLIFLSLLHTLCITWARPSLWFSTEEFYMAKSVSPNKSIPSGGLSDPTQEGHSCAGKCLWFPWSRIFLGGYLLHLCRSPAMKVVLFFFPRILQRSHGSSSIKTNSTRSLSCFTSVELILCPVGYILRWSLRLF